MGILTTRAEGHKAPTPRTDLSRDSEGVGLREEQVASLEVIIEVEESTIVSIGVGWGLPPAFASVGVQDTVVCMNRVTQVHTLLLFTFYGTSAHQVGEGKMQWPFRGEVGLGQSPHSLTYLQKQLSASLEFGGI